MFKIFENKSIFWGTFDLRALSRENRQKHGTVQEPTGPQNYSIMGDMIFTELLIDIDF